MQSETEMIVARAALYMVPSFIIKQVRTETAKLIMCQPPTVLLDNGFKFYGGACSGLPQLFVVLWLQCVCMITTGAISISKMMMVNHSLQELIMGHNNIGDDGISAIGGALGNCKINTLDIGECGITFTGARSLAASLLSNHTIRLLVLGDNSITVEGALLIVKSAVDNTVCQRVDIDYEYKNDEIEKMMNILEDRMEPEVVKWLLCDVINCHGNRIMISVNISTISVKISTVLKIYH